MSDPGTRKADASHAEIEKRLRTIYEQASKDIAERLDVFTARYRATDALMRRQLKTGEISESDYKKWLDHQVFTKRTWEKQASSIASTLLTANRQANRVIEGERRAVFGENATYQAYKLEKDASADLGFTVYDSAAVTRLIRNQPALLPVKDLDADKDTAWNRKKIAGIIARGIVSGDSLDKIADHMAEELSDGNRKAMLRYARTAMTAAQNAGRMEVLHEAVDMGIRVRKQWLATLDERTREAHQHLDGQIQDVEEPFDSDLGPIMFPGDPAADEANTWNCRCTLIYHYDEYPARGMSRHDQENGEDISMMSYDEWKEWADE